MRATLNYIRNIFNTHQPTEKVRQGQSLLTQKLMNKSICPSIEPFNCHLSTNTVSPFRSRGFSLNLFRCLLVLEVDFWVFSDSEESRAVEASPQNSIKKGQNRAGKKWGWIFQVQLIETGIFSSELMPLKTARRRNSTFPLKWSTNWQNKKCTLSHAYRFI